MDFKLNNFSGKAPVFPLPETVFFPKTFLPLNIFEDRYKKMLVDSLKNEKTICISLLKPGFEGLAISPWSNLNGVQNGV